MKIYQGETLDIIFNIKDDDGAALALAPEVKVVALISNGKSVECLAESRGEGEEKTFHLHLASSMTAKMEGEYDLQVAVCEGERESVAIGDPVKIEVVGSKIAEVL